MNIIKTLTKKIIKFRDKRNWKQFHNPKDVAISLSLEAAEVLEHFQWKSKAEINIYVAKHKSEVAEELADVLYWVLLMSHDLKIDIAKSLEEKIKKNETKYPINKSKNTHKKYTQLG